MMTDDRRRTLRRILLWGFVPFAIAGAVVSTKLISVNAFSDAAVSAFDRRSWNESETQARGLEWWNWIETWKAPFDIAVAIGMRGEPEDLEEARALLEHALELQGDPESSDYCVIYTNIVYVVEKQGDAVREEDQAAANELYTEALGIIEEAPEGCLEEPEASEANTQEQLEASVPRIEDKIVEDEGGEGDEGEDESDSEDDGDGDPSDDPQDGEDDNDPTEGEDQPSQEEQLEEQSQQAQEDQQEQEEYYDQQGEEGDAPPVDQPW